MAKGKDITLSEEVSIVGRALEIYKLLLQALERRGGTREHMKRILTDVALQDRIASALLADASEKTVETIIIPEDVTAEQLFADAKAAFEEAGIPFTYFDEDVISIIKRDLEFVKGETLEVLTHRFDHYWKTQEGRSLQKGQGFDGNAAAFLVWVTKTKKMGLFVSIADTDDRLFPFEGSLYAPYFLRGESYREFRLLGVLGKCFDDGLLVAFRVV